MSGYVNETDSDLIKKSDFDNELKDLNNSIKLNGTDLSYFSGKRFFDYDGKQNYPVFQLMYEYLERVAAIVNNTGVIYVHSWTSKGISNEKIKAPNTPSSTDQAPVLEDDGVKIRLKFTGDLLSQTRVTYNHGPKVSTFIVYKLNSHTINTDFPLKDCLFGAVKIKKDNYIDNYVDSRFGICFDRKST